MNTVEKIVEVLSDKVLWNQLIACSNQEDAMELLAKHGVETSLEELREAVIIVSKKNSVPAGENGELSEEDLEQVSGGFLGVLIERFLAWLFG